ncbi:MAG: TetR/AcrR family transcriptional regulator, partial [Cellvibrionaceae bacterium]|nr:TetR/AcrR family transcriptional regulator [Cellvibrionaceae bacterium]
ALKIEKILDTTLSLLSAGTADKITTNAIAKAAGISIGSLYQFFPNKGAIFYELFRRWLTQTLTALDQVVTSIDGDEAPEECIENMLQALAGGKEINAPGHWQLRRAMASSPDLVELERKHFEQILERILTVQVKFGVPVETAERRELALLQNQLFIACLQTLALTRVLEHSGAVRRWCKQILASAFDKKMLDA